MEFFLNGAQPSLNSGNLINHLNMNWNQFKDPVFRLCLAGAVVASWSPTQELAGSNPFTVVTNILSLKSANSVKTFRENSIVTMGRFPLLTQF